MLSRPVPPRPVPPGRSPAAVALVLVALLSGCASDRGPGEQAVATVEAAYAQVRPKARALAPERAAVIEAELARARTAAKEGDWVTVFTATSALPAEIERLSEEISIRTETSRAEWDSTNAAIAARLQDVDAAIERLTPPAPRPAGVGIDDVARARDELSAARVAWSQAIAARERGSYDDARLKAGEVQLRARRALSEISAEP